VATSGTFWLAAEAQGIAAAHDCLARIVTAGRVASPSGDVLIYDANGIRATYRLDGIGNIHDALFLQESLLIVNTTGNAVVSLKADGSTSSFWQGPPLFDAWHINCLFADDGAVFATAFGKSGTSCGWRAGTEGTGIVFRLLDEEVLVSGLDMPHHPRFIDGMLVVCNSAKFEVLGFDNKGAIVQKCVLDGFTRGIAYDSQHIWIGVSRLRANASDERSSHVVVLDRKTWTELGSFEVLVPEIYDLLIVSKSLASGVAKGHRSSRDDVHARGPLSKFGSMTAQYDWRVADLLPPSSRRFAIEVEIPSVLPPNANLKLWCHVRNHGDACIDSVGPFPVELSYRWTNSQGRAAPQAIRFELPENIGPGKSCAVEIVLATPGELGKFILDIFLTQEGTIDSAPGYPPGRYEVDVADTNRAGFRAPLGCDG